MKLLLSMLLLLSGCVSVSDSHEINDELSLYRTRLSLAVALIEQREKTTEEPLISQHQAVPRRHLYYFTADWCGPCRQVKRNVIPQLRASGWNQDWLTTVEADRNSELITKYQIETIPAFVVVKDGKLLGKRVGYVDHVTLATWANGLK